MANTTVKFRDGTEKRFMDRGRAGGSYSVQTKYQDGVVTIIDEWGEKTSYPLDLVAEVVQEAVR